MATRRPVRRGRWTCVRVFVAVAVAAAAAPRASAEAEPIDEAQLARPGAALRYALDLAAAGDVQRADAVLVAVAARHPLVADYADLERLRLALRAGRADDALALAEAWPHHDSRLRARVYAELGRARVERGEEDLARAAFQQALAATDDSAGKAALRRELARSYRRSGSPDAAANELIEIWMRAPRAPAADGVDAELAELEGVLGRTLRTADAWRRRGDALLQARYNEDALAAYDTVLAMQGLSESTRGRARAQRAEALFRLRRYPEATEAFAALPRTPENRITQARARARAGEVPAAAQQLETIASEVSGSQAAYAKLVAALLWEGEGEVGVARSRELFAALAPASPPYGTAATWRLGWQAYREGRYDEALGWLDRLVKAEADPVARLQARYWHARAAERAGHPDAAARFAELAHEFPLTYYGWRASLRVGEAASAPAPPPLERGTSVLAPAQLERPRILIEAGLIEYAREELDALFARARGLDDRLALARLYADAGDHHRPQRLAVDAYAETLARGPRRDVLELWWYAWPAPWTEPVNRVAQARTGLEPELVYAIMREESGYQPAVMSVAGARGLLQLMPETAERVARDLALAEFHPDDLFDPAVNIQLGGVYLDQLLRQFPGRASAAIGSYNAGPHRVVAWLEGSGLEDDEWVEAIPYDQTREYVKRVLRSVHAYRVLY